MSPFPPVSDWYLNPLSSGWACEPPEESAVAFHRELPGYEPTPLHDVPELAQQLGVGRLFVKDESQRFDLGAFKFLGASWAVHRALEQSPGTRALTCATDGNHGRAVARMARTLGLASTVFIPRGVPDIVIDRVRAEGADVRVVDVDYDKAIDAARAFAAEHADTLIVQDTSWPGYDEVPTWIVEGYSTMFVETDEQLRAAGVAAPDLVVAPVGVGSMAQACVTHYRHRDIATPPRVLSAEPDTAACVLESLRQGEPVSVATTGTIMNGLNCGTPSSLAWPLLRGGLDIAAAVTDEGCRSAMAALRKHGVESGPSGAATFAALAGLLEEPDAADVRRSLNIGPDAVVVCFSTEGPIRA